MTFDDYQSKARTTAIYPREQRVIYPTIGLAGESGEVSEKVKKFLRGDDGEKISAERTVAIGKELGDVLWYVANIASDLGLSLGSIAQWNIDKLHSRKERGTLQGSGDER